ncbi:hypothetical protein JHK85_011623 [Glycine max]|nr:hypothetical protein JHK85_011623 [Glycine max]
MASEKVETVVAGNYLEMEREEEGSKSTSGKLSRLFWHGGSVYDAWFSCASNQALTHTALIIMCIFPILKQIKPSFGVAIKGLMIFLLFYGLMGSWTAYLISVLYVEYRTRKEREKVDFRNHVIQWFEVLDGLLGKHWRNLGLFFNCTFLLFGSVIQLIACASNIYYINDNLDKRTWTYIFGACCATTVFIPSFHNYRMWSFLGLVMTTYTAWYMTIASLTHGQAEGVTHTGPAKLVLYFTGATNILYTFVYWAFGDQLLTHSNALSLLPRSGFRDTAVILMLIHQFITFGFACTPLYFVWEKFIGVHETKSLFKRALARLPVVIPIWFLAIIFPFFGPINSTVGSLLVSFTVYIIPALAHMVTFASAPARENAVERPPSKLGGWVGLYSMNVFVVVWVLVVGFGLGGWASMINFIHQIDTFGLFAKCYQCPPHKA